MTLAQARQSLFQWEEYLKQLTEAEEMCKRYNIILLYNPKAHPWLNPMEKYWRLVKYETQDLLDLKVIKAQYNKLLEEFMSGSDDVRTKCKKWFRLSPEMNIKPYIPLSA